MKNDLIIVQWTNYFGGLEKISQKMEEIFYQYNPLILQFIHINKGLNYKNYYIVKGGNKFSSIFNYFFFVRKRRNSIFHIQYMGTKILLLTFLAGARKIVFHFHGTKLLDFNKLVWKLLEKKVVIISNSLYAEKVIKEKLKINSKINIIPNLIDLHEYKFSERVYNGNKFIVTFAGRFDKDKNVDMIVETVKMFVHSDEVIEFWLVGDGPEKQNLEKKIKEYHLTNIIKMFPFTKEILRIYYNSNLFLFVSLYESFGNVVAEAILTGLPVICYKIPALTEIIKDDIFFIDKLQPKLIYEKIHEFRNNYKMINERLAKVNEYLRIYLDNEKIINHFNSIYKGLRNQK